MKRFILSIYFRISRTKSLFFFLFFFLSNVAVVAHDGVADLPVPLFSGWGIWDITRACTSDNCMSPRDTIGKKICCIETMVEQILQITCVTQSIVGTLEQQIAALQSCQEDICNQNAIDISLVEEIESLSDAINAQLCDLQTITETISDNAMSIEDELNGLLQTNQSILDLADAILNLVQSNLITLSVIDTIDASIIAGLMTAQSYENSIHNTLSITDLKLETLEDTTLTIISKITDVDSKLDPLISEANSILSKLDVIEACSPTPISAPTTISSAGVYCLTTDIPGQITIAASNVQLLLNGHRVYGGTNGIDISTARQRVTITGPGSVDSVTNAGIQVGSGSSVISVSDVNATSAGVAGFLVNGTTNSLVQDIQFSNCSASSCPIGLQVANTSFGSIDACDFSSNTTGVQYTNCVALAMQDTNARSNAVTGFSLVSSGTNTFIQCTALSNGIGSSGSSFGFVSTNGAGNIFENCIADGVTTLTTNFNAIVAGFAFTGSEMCSKIIGCEAVNASAPTTTSIVNTATLVSGPTAYGVLLQGSLNQSTSLLSNSTVYGDSVNSLDWSGDGKYLAMGGHIVGSDNGTVNVYQFDPSSGLLTLINSPQPIYGNTISSLQWSPDNKYLAVGGNVAAGIGTVNVYQFNAVSGLLTLINSPTPSYGSQIKSLDWSPDGKYLAVGGGNGTVNIYQFNPSSDLLTLVSTTSYGSTINSLQWSPNGKYLAMGGTVSVDGTVNIYQFNASSGVLTLVNTSSQLIYGIVINSLQWSPDGSYIAVGGFISLDSSTVNIYQFNPSSGLLTFVNSGSQPAYGNVINSLQWSPDGKYVVVGGVIRSSGTVNIYQFNLSLGTLSLVNNQPIFGNQINSVQWSPDGQFLAIGGERSALTGGITTYSGLTFPSSNIVKDSLSYCNTVGISGSSIANAIINDTAYCNSAFNYQFVTNVFINQSYSSPSVIQNVGVNCTESLLNPLNINEQTNALLAQAQNVTVVESNMSILDRYVINNLGVVQSLIDRVIAKENSVIATIAQYPLLTQTQCSDTALTNTGSFTISSAGVYCLANNVTGKITIAASNVTLNLNGHVVTNSVDHAIQVNNNLSQVAIFNGTVQSTLADGIAVGNSCTRITVTDVIAHNSAHGISLGTVAYGTIQHCDLSSNATGLQLTNANNIMINNCVATGNSSAGISLISSSTNTISNCKALDTGTTSADGTYGFISQNGTANIFSYCVADGTTTATTNVNAIVAGFALTGSEMCSEISNCTSVNNFVISTTSLVNTSTLSIAATAYGILVKDSMILTASSSSISSVTTADSGQPAWSPNGRYFAVVNLVGGTLQIVDVLNPLAPIVIATVATSAFPIFGDWSPDGRYIAVITLTNRLLQIFDTTVITTPRLLTSLSVGTNPNDVKWSPNGQYIAVANNSSSTLQIVSMASPGYPVTVSTTAVTLAQLLSWSPNGKYIAVRSASTAVQIFDVSVPSSPSLLSTISTTGITTVAWSPNGAYLALTSTTGNTLLIYNVINPSSPALISTTSVNTSPQAVWSANNKYVGILAMGSNTLQIYSVANVAAPVLLATVPITAGSSAIAWSPDGEFFAVTFSAASSVQLFNVLQFPSRNVIRNNTVSCNQGGTSTQPFGIGISGSSIANLIIGNLAYDNNLFNYAFVTNVFSQSLYGTSIPSSLQNIALAANTPITKPINTYQETNIIVQQAVTMSSLIDRILAKVAP